MRIAILVLATVVLCGCGESATPDPSPSMPTVASLAIAPATDLLKLKATEQWTASATLSSGAVQPVTATWTSSASAVASVDGTGRVTALSPGQTTIAATYQGKSASRELRVVPDYGGRWEGTASLVSCQVQGEFQPDWCARLQGSTALRLDLLQTRDYVSGSWVLLQSSGVVQGTIATTGTLSLTGTAYQAGATITIAEWQASTTDNQRMTGRFTLVWTVPGLSGSARTEVEIRDCIKA